MLASQIKQALELGLEHYRFGRLHEAELIYRQVLTVRPDDPDALHLLGMVANRAGQSQIASDLITRAIARNPLNPDYHANLAIALIALGKLDLAYSTCQAALKLQPSLPEASYNAGVILQTKSRLPEAANAYRTAIQYRPRYYQAHLNLGTVLLMLGDSDGAIAEFRAAIQLKPDFAEAHGDLGSALVIQGELDAALAAFRKALEIDPTLWRFHSNLVFNLHYHPEFAPSDIFREHRIWNQQHAVPLKGLIRPHANSWDPNRRLRIGYVSAYFTNDSTGRFFPPLLEYRNRNDFEVFCYSGVRVPDDMTKRLQLQADVWREVATLSDAQLADSIREDGIDILIDLMVHQRENRMLTFAQKPAPVQVTYLGYCSTTGLDTIDYRLTDPFLDPKGVNDAYYSEQSVYLPKTYWCYEAFVGVPEVNSPPAASSGGLVTFGCLNTFSKVTAMTLAMWCQLLRSSRISSGIARSGRKPPERVRDMFQVEAVDQGRLRFVGDLPTADYYAQYGNIDIALDPFPYGGGTTTCDALWMGVPVVTLTGKTAVSRAGLSLLSNVGLQELVASSKKQYVHIAAELAGDLLRLATIRSTLRERMRCSPLMDAAGFVRGVEHAYRAMWTTWCAKSSSDLKEG